MSRYGVPHAFTAVTIVFISDTPVHLVLVAGGISHWLLYDRVCRADRV